MERHEVLEMMAALKLAGMRAAFDEILADGLKRQHPVQRIVGALLKAEIADKQARSIKYQMSVAKLPLAKELSDFDFAGTPVNEPLVRELAAGGFLASQRNAVLIGAGKSHLAIAIARACIRDGARLSVAGLVLVRQRPGSAKGVVFITLEDETGVANLIVWPKALERFCRVVMTARLLRASGRLQREGIVAHLVAEGLEDCSHLLDTLDAAGRLAPQRSRADEYDRPPRPDPRDSQTRRGHALPRHPRDQAGTLFPSRDFH